MEYFKQESEFIPDKLFAGSAVPVLKGFAELESGQGIVERGALIGKSSDGRFYVMGSSESSDTVPYGILADTVDTADEKVNTTVYLSGMFNRSAVFAAEEADISDYEYELRKLSIYLENVAE